LSADAGLPDRPRRRFARFWLVSAALAGLGACAEPSTFGSDAGLASDARLVRPPTVAPGLSSGSASQVRPAAAESPLRSLVAALETTYQTNPQLNEARQQLKVVDEQVSQALSAFRPQAQASINGYYLHRVSEEETSVPQATKDAQSNATVTVAQPLYTPGAAAAVRSAENTVLAARATLSSVEQQVLVAALTSAVQVWRDRQLVKLLKDNEDALTAYSDITRQRFTYGEVSNTDNLQTETRLSKARADRIAAEGTLEGSRAAFRQIVGQEPDDLDELPAGLLDQYGARVPASLEEALTVAGQSSAEVISSRYAVAAAREAVDAVGRDLWPQLRLIGSFSHSFDYVISRPPPVFISSTPSSWSQARSYQVGLELVVPLYRGGSTDSQVRAARQTVGQRQFDVDISLRTAERAVTTAWQSVSAARRALADRLRAVSAAEQALDGVRREAVAGTRTVLDILNAQQEVVDAQAALVTTRTSHWTATATLLSALGRFTAQELGLKVPLFDPEQNYRSVRNRWIGTSIEMPSALAPR
jgi:TolC family type I secretion outer membrane protein